MTFLKTPSQSFFKAQSTGVHHIRAWISVAAACYFSLSIYFQTQTWTILKFSNILMEIKISSEHPFKWESQYL